MAYRFNPPPNWPIDDAGWTPPPGWQPDPAWGPAPDGWNFWVEGGAEPTGAPPAPASPGVPAEDDATRLSGSGDATHLSGSGDATHVASSEDPSGPGAADGSELGVDRGAEAQVLGEDGSTWGESFGDRQIPAAGGSPSQAETSGGEAPETAVYGGPDLEADLAQDAPYESATPDTFGDQERGRADGPSGAAPGGAALGGAASGAHAAGGQDQGAAGGVPGGGVPGGGEQQAAAPAPDQAASAYGQAPQDGYGQAPPTGYGQASPNGGYGQASPNGGYGQASPNGYGQASPNGYGQASPNGYGQPSASDPAAAGWTATTATGQGPQKGFLARFWWIGCIVLFLIAALILALVLGFTLLGGGGTDEAQTTSPTTSEETTSEEATTEEESPEEEEATSPAPTTALPTIDPSAQVQDITSETGSGTMAVHMAWVPGEQLSSNYGAGETIEPSPRGDYLVVTAQMTVTDGTMSFSPYQFELMTPYGGAVDIESSSYSLADSGMDYDTFYEFKPGESYTVTWLYAPQRAPGLVLTFDNYFDQYSWAVPE